MIKYLYIYSGANQPSSQEAVQAKMAAWMAYFERIGPALVDHGAPLMPGATLLGSAESSGATGFSIIQAESMEQALALTAGHPHLNNGGGIEVLEYAPMPSS